MKDISKSVVPLPGVVIGDNPCNQPVFEVEEGVTAVDNPLLLPLLVVPSFPSPPPSTMDLPLLRFLEATAAAAATEAERARMDDDDDEEEEEEAEEDEEDDEEDEEEDDETPVTC